MMTFSDLFETIKNLASEEKQEIQRLLQQYLREERRDTIYNNFQMSIAEQTARQLKFSSDLDPLKQLIEE